MKQGDLVTRQSYGHDVLFKIEYIVQEMAVLRGIEFRLLADAPIKDLKKADRPSSAEGNLAEARSAANIRRLEDARKQWITRNLRVLSTDDVSNNSYFEVPGKVLHLDGDESYLRKSLELYRQLRVPAEGHHIAESSMSEAIVSLFPRVKPDILVITGHDGMLKGKENDKQLLSGYKNSQHFVRAIHAARQFERNRDSLTIIAGACQSHFEALLQAGANFASSPARILIHALDPVHIAAKVSYTSVKETINMVDVISHTVSGLKGIGGIESRGSYRIGLPNIYYK